MEVLFHAYIVAFKMLWVIRDMVITWPVWELGAEFWEVERRRKGRRGQKKKNLLAPPVRFTADLNNLSHRRISPQTVSDCPRRTGYLHWDCRAFSVFGLQRELVRCWCWGDKSFISHLVISPSHLFSLPLHTGGILDGCCALRTGVNLFLFLFSSSTLSFSAFEPLKTKQQQQLQQQWQIRRSRSPTLSQTQQLWIPARPWCGTVSAPRMASPTTITSKPKAPGTLSSSPRARRWKSQTVWREKVTSSIMSLSCLELGFKSYRCACYANVCMCVCKGGPGETGGVFLPIRSIFSPRSFE